MSRVLFPVETLLSKLESLPPGYNVSFSEDGTITYHREDGTIASGEDILADEEKFLYEYLRDNFMTDYYMDVTRLPNIRDFIREYKENILELVKDYDRSSFYEIVYDELVYDYVTFIIGGTKLTDEERKRLFYALVLTIVNFKGVMENWSPDDYDEDEIEEIASRYKARLGVEDLDSTAVEAFERGISRLAESLAAIET